MAKENRLIFLDSPGRPNHERIESREAPVEELSIDKKVERAYNDADKKLNHLQNLVEGLYHPEVGEATREDLHSELFGGHFPDVQGEISLALTSARISLREYMSGKIGPEDLEDDLTELKNISKEIQGYVSELREAGIKTPEERRKNIEVKDDEVKAIINKLENGLLEKFKTVAESNDADKVIKAQAQRFYDLYSTRLEDWKTDGGKSMLNSEKELKRLAKIEKTMDRYIEVEEVEQEKSPAIDTTEEEGPAVSEEAGESEVESEEVEEEEEPEEAGESEVESKEAEEEEEPEEAGESEVESEEVEEEPAVSEEKEQGEEDEDSGKTAFEEFLGEEVEEPSEEDSKISDLRLEYIEDKEGMKERIKGISEKDLNKENQNRLKFAEEKLKEMEDKSSKLYTAKNLEQAKKAKKTLDYKLRRIKIILENIAYNIEEAEKTDETIVKESETKIDKEAGRERDSDEGISPPEEEPEPAVSEEAGESEEESEETKPTDLEIIKLENEIRNIESKLYDEKNGVITKVEKGLNSLMPNLKEIFKQNIKNINKRFEETSQNPNEEQVKKLQKNIEQLESYYLTVLKYTNTYNKVQEKSENLYNRYRGISENLSRDQAEEIDRKYREINNKLKKIKNIISEQENKTEEPTEPEEKQAEAEPKEAEEAEEKEQAVDTEVAEEEEEVSEGNDGTNEEVAEEEPEAETAEPKSEEAPEDKASTIREGAEEEKSLKPEELDEFGKVTNTDQMEGIINACKNKVDCKYEEKSNFIMITYKDKRYEIKKQLKFILSINKFDKDGNLQKEIVYDRNTSAKNPVNIRKIHSGEIRTIMENGTKAVEKYNKSGSLTEYVVELDGKKIEPINIPKTYNLKVTPIKNKEGEIIEIVGSKNNEKIYSIKKLDDGSYKRVMYTAKGREFGTFKEEKRKNADLTMDDYIKNYIEGELKDGDRISVYLALFLKYKGADDDSQKLEQALNNQNEFIEVDCEEYAEIAKRARRARGANAFVLVLDGKKAKYKHAVCVEVKEYEGYYYAQKWDNIGYKRSGKNKTATGAINNVLSMYGNGEMKDNRGKKQIYRIAFKDSSRVEVYEDGKIKKKKISDMFITEAEKEEKYADKKEK